MIKGAFYMDAVRSLSFRERWLPCWRLAAQAPAGAAQAAAVPDAVATNLVTTVCAACHTLDRVKNKVADKDAWTTTVARMKDKGAALTDQQVPPHS